MTSRERVLRVFEHKEADKVPVDFGGTVVTCLDYKAHKKLKKHLNIPDGDDPIIDYSMGTVEPCEELKVRFESDFRRVALNYGKPDIIDHIYTDGFGMKLKQALPHLYFDVIYNPLKNAAVKDIQNMKMPDPDNPSIYKGLKERAKDLYENSPYAVIADFGVPGFYETSQKLRGYQVLACDLLIEPDLIKVLYGRLLELQKSFFKNYIDHVGKYVQVICYADDLGMQDTLQISPEIYREMIKPFHKEIFNYIHGMTDAKIMLHSCGAVSSIINDLIEAGVDILNPVQTRAKGMDPQKLKDAFGDRIIFWGAFDEQYTLPKGSIMEIEDEAKKLLKVLGKGGGYVFAPGHNIQDDTPPENIVAMYETAKKYRDYR